MDALWSRLGGLLSVRRTVTILCCSLDSRVFLESLFDGARGSVK